MNSVLLTVSGYIPVDLDAQVAAGRRPEPDYAALSRGLPADLLDYAGARKAGGPVGRLLERLVGPNLALAWACFRLRRRYSVLFTDGEQVGIPLALLLKLAGGRSRARHLMISHVLSVGKKTIFFDRLKIHSHIDTFFVYSSWQKQFIQARWKIPPGRVILTPFMVDASFFSPESAPLQNPYTAELGDPLVCAVGLEFRDYPTLIEAARGLDARVVIAAASPWSRRKDSTSGKGIPPNVIVRRFSQYELRQLYAASRFLVMPLYDVNFQAGVTTLLEAMAMGKAVICSRTSGQTDVVVEGKTGLYVPPGDPGALRAAIEVLLENPEDAERMGQAGRQRVLERMSLACYVERFKAYILP